MLYTKQVVFPRIKRKRLVIQGYSFLLHTAHTPTHKIISY